jgi:hypothetical protein
MERRSTSKVPKEANMQLELPFRVFAQPEVIRYGLRLAYPRWVYEYERARLKPRYNRDRKGRFY